MNKDISDKEAFAQKIAQTEDSGLTPEQKNLVQHIEQAIATNQKGGTCTTAAMKKDREYDYHKYWKDQYEKEKKKRQEAENEMVLIKGITVTNSPELRAANNEINDLKNRIADLEESVRSKDYFKDPDYEFLVNENHRLEQQYLEVIADNKKLTKEIEDQIIRLRKSAIL